MNIKIVEMGLKTFLHVFVYILFLASFVKCIMYRYCDNRNDCSTDMECQNHECICQEPYFPMDTEFRCYLKKCSYSYDPHYCGENMYCHDNDYCKCHEGFRFENYRCYTDECNNNPYYYHLIRNCSENMHCSENNRCFCDEGYVLNYNESGCHKAQCDGYSSQTEEPFNLQNCGDNMDCHDNDYCRCNEGYVLNSDGRGCHKEYCSDFNSSQSCGENMYCHDNDYCKCDQGYILNNDGRGCHAGECGEFYNSVTCGKNMHCISSGYCICDEGYVMDVHGKGCQKDNRQPCTYDTDCTHENMYCPDREFCGCKKNFVPKKYELGCMKEIMQPCAWCLGNISNTECINYNCYCKDGYILSSNKKACIPFAHCYKQNCSEDVQCSTLSPYSVCRNSKCVCQDGYLFNHEKKTCQSILEDQEKLIRVNFDFDNYKIIDSTEEELVLQCNVTDEEDQFDLQWRRNGVLLAIGCDKRIKFISTENKIVIIKPSEEDSGNYSCTFVSKFRGTSVSATISLVVKPSVELLTTSAFLGENLELVCELTGNPLPSVEWLFDNEALNDNVKRFLLQSDFRRGKHVAVMTLYNVTFDDSGIYTCLANNKVIPVPIKSSLEILIRERNSPWIPFLGICGEVLALCLIILVIERKHIKNMEKKNETENKQ